jgi:hypothetical protein
VKHIDTRSELRQTTPTYIQTRDRSTTHTTLVTASGALYETTPHDTKASQGYQRSTMVTQNTTYDYLNVSYQSYKCSLEGWREDRRSAELLFRRVVNGQPVSSPGIEPKSNTTSTALDARSKCKDLAIDVCCGNDPVSICAVQDMFFAFVDRIPKDHCLRSLTSTITVVLPNDNNERPWIVSDVWPSAF